MHKYFNVFLQFDHPLFYRTVEDAIKNSAKGYVCVVDANVLTIAQKDLSYRQILNQSLVNTCDGSSIALMASKIHKKDYKALNGPEIFEHYIEMGYVQLLLGSNDETSNEIKSMLRSKGINDNHLSVLSLPFKSVEEFDYPAIATQINTIRPAIIWVSLGAPKQEVFMANILPYLAMGVMFGIGAAFNFYTGKIGLPSTKIGKLKLIWVSRIISEPKKQIKRILPYLFMMPTLYWQEMKNFKVEHKRD